MLPDEYSPLFTKSLYSIKCDVNAKTVDIVNKKDAIISIEGRHDVCIAPRAVPAIESVVAIALLDTILDA